MDFGKPVDCQSVPIQRVVELHLNAASEWLSSHSARKCDARVDRFGERAVGRTLRASPKRQRTCREAIRICLTAYSFHLVRPKLPEARPVRSGKSFWSHGDVAVGCENLPHVRQYVAFGQH